MITLNPNLKKDSYLLGHIDNSAILLMRNALFPWFVIVPDTEEIEFYKLHINQQIEILHQITAVSRFIEENNQIDKMNIATIGNFVSQLHIHIVGRNKLDECWPGVVWGSKAFEAYEMTQVKLIKEKLSTHLGNNFKTH